MSIYFFFLKLGFTAHQSQDYSSSRINAHLMFPLFPENQKSIPEYFSGKKLLKKM